LIKESAIGLITKETAVMKLQKRVVPCPLPTLKGRSRPFRSILVAVAGALLLTAAFVPRANATVIVYFNFEDGTIGELNTFDMAADVVGAPDFNPGGGIQMSTLTLGPYSPNHFGTVDALAIASLNRTAGDIDTTNNAALLLNKTMSNEGAFLQFNVDTTFLQDLSLSFAVDNNGNGFNTVTLSYSSTGPGGPFTQIGSPQFIVQGPAILITGAGSWGTTFNVTPSATGVFQLTFTGGQSNGNNRETVIDNIVLGGTVIPEPATVVGGLLGACGLGWHQRRRLIRLVRLRRA
jgi:hypothetical protein